jgi:PBSX family phage portal protein
MTEPPAHYTASEAHEQVQVLLKAVVLGQRAAQQASTGGGESITGLFGAAGALEPPYDPEALCLLFEHSNALRQNVDAYATNIDGFGFRLDPAIDFDAEDADRRVAECLYLERLAAQERGELPADAELEPSDEQVKERRRELVRLARAERARLMGFFESCSFEHSFVELRRRTRQDLEVTGNAYWEVLRNARGEVARLVHVPAYTMRLMPLDAAPVEVSETVRVSPVAVERLLTPQRLRRFVQIQYGQRTFFKQLGDPRVLSRKTGQAFQSLDELLAADHHDGPATEILHFAIHSPRSPYGIPRWVGTMLAVMGSRQMEEINFLYFENKSVPPLALLVSGGRLSEASVPRIERFIEENLKGKANFHKILVLEAEGGSHTSDAARARIELRPLTDAQQQDALFQQYDERNIDKVGSSFRLPRLLRGDSRDFNRACHSADTETLTEDGWKLHGDIGPTERIAVYDPERDELRFEVPANKFVAQVTEPLLHFSSRHADCLVTADHRMLVKSPGANRWTVEAADRCAVRGRMQFLCNPRFDLHGRRLKEMVLPRKCRISRGHTHDPIPGDLWLEFLGYFMSDGGLLETDHPSAPYLVFVRQKKFYRGRIERCLRLLGWRHSIQQKADGTLVYTISNRCLRDWLLRHCGGRSKGRHLPWQYVTGLPVEQLKILYDAMMDGDGTRSWRLARRSSAGSQWAAFHTGSLLAADQMQALCLRLGFRTKLTYSAHSRAYRVSHVAKRTTRLHGRTDVAAVPYAGEVYCFSCPGAGFFVTRRNGKVAIHGNSADAQLRFAEDQVFQPERDEFDYVLTKRLLGDMGIRFWRFRSQTPVTRDPERMTDMVEKLVRVGVLTPEEGRQLASDIFNREFPKLTADWVKRPITLTLAGIQTGSGEPPSKPAEETLVDETKRRMALAREAFERPEPVRIVVPVDEWGQWFAAGGHGAAGPR